MDMSQVQKQITTQDATDGSIAAFQGGDAERAVDFQAFMMGTPVMEGGQHDMSPRGMTSDRGEWQQPPEGGPNPLIPPQPAFVNVPAHLQEQPTPTPSQDYQRLYGQSENEKGELRRALQQQMQANEQLLGQITQMSTAFTQAPSPYPTHDPYAPQGNYSYAPPTITYAPPPQHFAPTPQPTRFVSKADDEMILAGDLEGTLQQVMAPAYQTLYADVQRAHQQNAELRAMLVQGEKERRGITPQVEAQALVQRPWLRNLQSNPQAYLGALTDYAGTQQNTALLARTAPPLTPTTPMATVPGTPQAAARRITYIEGGNMAGGAPVEALTPQAQFNKEMVEASREPHIGKRAQAMRTVMAKYGISETSGWTDPSVVTR